MEFHYFQISDKAIIEQTISQICQYADNFHDLYRVKDKNILKDALKYIEHFQKMISKIDQKFITKRQIVTQEKIDNVFLSIKLVNEDLKDYKKYIEKQLDEYKV